jgi:outer membrane protein, heavy metal efflux system
MKMRVLIVGVLSAGLVVSSYGQEAASDAGAKFSALTLDEALALAEANSPKLAEARHAAGMAEGDVITAGLWPNPTVTVAVEGYTPGGESPPPDRTRLENGVEVTNRLLARGGSAVSLFVPGVPDPDEPDQQQWIVGVSQEVPLGPARRHRRMAAALDQARLEFEQRQAVADVHGAVRGAFLDALYFQEAAALQAELMERLAEVRDLVAARFGAGDVAELEVIKANAAFARFEADARETVLQAGIARTTLAETMGLPDAVIGECAGNLAGLLARLDDGAAAALDLGHPLSEAWAARQSAAEARIAAADAERWPRLELGLGYRYYDATEQDTWDFSVGMEVPVFDRNQGGRHKAREGALREAAAIAGERNDVARGLLNAARSADQYREAEVRYSADVVEPMEEVLQIAQAAYDAGDAGLLDVLDAHRELAEARLNLAGYQRKYGEALNELVRLTAAAR